MFITCFSQCQLIEWGEPGGQWGEPESHGGGGGGGGGGGQWGA